MTIARWFAGEFTRITTVPWQQFIILFLVTLLLYGRTLGFDFVWDDAQIIVNNPYLQSWHTLAELLFTEDRASEVSTGYYRPLTYFSFLVDRSFWGAYPLGFHLTNILLHAAVVIVLYIFLRTITGGWVAFASALMFAVHPFNAETVCFLSGGRNTLLAALFGLLAILYHVRYRPFAAMLSFALSICSKETAILLPILLVFCDNWLLGRPVSFRNYLPYLGAGSCYLAIRAYVLEGGGFNFQLETIASRLLLAPHLVFKYASRVAWPADLRIPYDLSTPLSFDLLTILVVLGLFFVLIAMIKFRRYPAAFFALWFLLFLVPVLNIIPLGGIAMANRYAYLSAMGGTTILAICCEKFAGKWKNSTCALCVICFMLIAIGESNDWKSNRSLFARMISDAPELSTGYYNMGLGLYEDGDILKALPLLEQALKAPHKLEPEQILLLLAMINWELGEKERAQRVFTSLSSKLQNDPKLMAIYARFFDDIGFSAQRDKLLSKAGITETEYVRMLRDYTSRPLQKAARHMASLETDLSARLYARVLLLDPVSIEGLLGIGNVALLRNNLPIALGYYEKVAALQPSDLRPWAKLADVYLRLGRSAEAARANDRYNDLLEASHR